MFEGYDPERRPPYSQTVLKDINGETWKYIYLVSNFYGGTRIVSYSAEKISDEAYNEDEGTVYEDQRKN